MTGWRGWTLAIRTSSTRRYTTDMCQDIPRLPNQSACDSRYLCGKNSIAQFFTMKTVSWLRASMMSRRAWSWCADRNKWHFHDWMASVAWLVRNKASSLSASVWNWNGSQRRIQVFALLAYVFVSVIALLPRVWVGTIANGKHTVVTGYLGVGANVNLSRNAFEYITRHTCIAKIATLIRYIFNWPWVKENKGKNRVRLKQNTITK